MEAVAISLDEAKEICHILRQLLKGVGDVTKTWVVNKDSQWQCCNPESEKTFNEVIIPMWENMNTELTKKVNKALTNLGGY